MCCWCIWSENMHKVSSRFCYNNKKNCISNKNETINKLLSLAMSNAYMHKHTPIRAHIHARIHTYRAAINDGQVGNNAESNCGCMRTIYGLSVWTWTSSRTFSFICLQLIEPSRQLSHSRNHTAVRVYGCVVLLYLCAADVASCKCSDENEHISNSSI